MRANVFFFSLSLPPVFTFLPGYSQALGGDVTCGQVVGHCVCVGVCCAFVSLSSSTPLPLPSQSSVETQVRPCESLTLCSLAGIVVRRGAGWPTPRGPLCSWLILSGIISWLELCYFSFGSEVPSRPVFGTLFFSRVRCGFWLGSFSLGNTGSDGQWLAHCSPLFWLFWPGTSNPFGLHFVYCVVCLSLPFSVFIQLIK